MPERTEALPGIVLWERGGCSCTPCARRDIPAPAAAPTPADACSSSFEFCGGGSVLSTEFTRCCGTTAQDVRLPRVARHRTKALARAQKRAESRSGGVGREGSEQSWSRR
eukprot:1489804-Rhodomonas_salina.2